MLGSVDRWMAVWTEMEMWTDQWEYGQRGGSMDRGMTVWTEEWECG